MRRILIAEDDRRLASLMKDYLEANDFEVDIEENGDRVADALQTFAPDILVLDVMLPGKDGLTICRESRPNFTGPILILTARNDDADQILGLEFGADDYVIKPVEPRVLLARIKALLRRCEQSHDEAKPKDITLGTLSIHQASRSVKLADEPVHVSSHEFDLLALLASKAGLVISREDLFQALCGRAYDGLDRTIDVRISQLRKKLGDNLDNPRRIKTIWGKGYLFVHDAWI